MTEQRRRLGETLRSAREARGLDRARIERDTRIRERYLSALERGAYEELPGDVYARGFLRTYARYLKLEPDELMAMYRLETQAPTTAAHGRAPSRARSIDRPRPRGILLLTPTVVTAVVLTVAVGALMAYVAYQVITFARTPDLRIVEPVSDVAGHDEPTIVIRGVTAPNARVTINGLPVNPSVMADADGNFSVRVELLPGSNVVTVSALDPTTTRAAPDVTRTIEFVGPPDARESRSPPSAQQG